MADEKEVSIVKTEASIVEIEDNGCRCGECIPCKLREFMRKAEEEGQVCR